MELDYRKYDQFVADTYEAIWSLLPQDEEDYVSCKDNKIDFHYQKQQTITQKYLIHIAEIACELKSKKLVLTNVTLVDKIKLFFSEYRRIETSYKNSWAHIYESDVLKILQEKTGKNLEEITILIKEIYTTYYAREK